MDSNISKEQEFVWDSIAESWDRLRKRPIKEIEYFVRNSHGNLLDMACGSGRNFVETDAVIFGTDFSENMIRLCIKNSAKKGVSALLTKASNSQIPFKNNTFDYIVYAFSLHCIGRNDRDESLKELRRVLKPRGRAIIGVWNRMQPMFFFKKRDFYVSWRTQGRKFERYYHPFTKKELAKTLEKSGFDIISIKGQAENKVYKIFSRNIIAVVTKRG